MKLKGKIIDLEKREIYYGQVEVAKGKIAALDPLSPEPADAPYILPGFIDAHVHIESSMLVPSEFARLAVVHGTVATVSDPHEIANVLGVEGVEFMIENGKEVPFKFFFGAPSCVPATPFETSGAVIDEAGVRYLLEKPEIKYLAEMMNYPGVLQREESVMAKIEIAGEMGKPVDGHAPGLRGKEAHRYIDAGITTDHECYTYEEGLEKLQHGMRVIIREGSAARNFDALIDLLPEYPDRIMFCSDDKHPDDLVTGHINKLVGRALAGGYDLYQVLRAACVNPVEHYNLEVGQLRVGDPADFIVVDDLEQMRVISTFIDGKKVAAHDRTLIPRTEAGKVNQFGAGVKKPEDFHLKAEGENIQVIQAIEGALITGSFTAPVKTENGWAVADPDQDILKITVVNRYAEAPPAIGFIQGFNIKEGAIASCVAHDSHNIVAVGTDDRYLSQAVNLIIQNEGGISAVGAENKKSLALPVAGIMCDRDGYQLANTYSDIDSFARNKLNCKLQAPFMTLSFMALLVIPDLKLSDRGLFDGQAFQFTQLFV